MRKKNLPVVGSFSRILYADAEGRILIAEAFNRAIKSGKLKGPVVLGRDHHDVSGTDSPFRETANIYDGSRFTADMAVHNFVGDSFRGATWVSLHNGGGVGWGEVVNGGFGMVLDGSAGCPAAVALDAFLGREQRHRPPCMGPQPERAFDHRTGRCEARTWTAGDGRRNWRTRRWSGVLLINLKMELIFFERSNLTH